MGCFDIFCFICGNPYWAGILKDIKSSKKYNIISSWMNKCTILTTYNKIVHGCEETTCNGSFVDKYKNGYDTHYFEDKYDYLNEFEKSIYLHTDCWKFIKQQYGIELQFKDVPFKFFNFKNRKNIDKPILIDYGKIESYWGQDMNFKQMIEDGNDYQIYSPLVNNSKNINRIKKICSQMKFKIGRAGPSVSATFYDNKSIKYGNNNKFWIKTKGKWQQLDIDVHEVCASIKRNDTTMINKINKIPCIGEWNTSSLFIKQYGIKGKTLNITLIGSQDNIKKILNNAHIYS